MERDQMNSLPAQGMSADKMLRFPEVEALVGLSRSTIDRLIRAGDFPVPKKLGARSVGFSSADIARWQSARADARPLPVGA
jgi:prophage regulatory protein